MPFAILMCGVPGSGKTLVRDQLLSILPKDMFTVVAPDDIVEDVGRRLEMTYRQVYDNPHLKDYCYNRSRDHLRTLVGEGENVLIDRTHIDEAYREKTLMELGGAYTTFCCHVQTPPALVWVHRLDQRPGKPIPPEILFNFIRKHTVPTEDEGFSSVLSCTSDNLGMLPEFVDHIKQMVWRAARRAELLNA